MSIAWRDGKLVSADVWNTRSAGPRASVDVAYGEKTTRLQLDVGGSQPLDAGPSHAGEAR